MLTFIKKISLSPLLKFSFTYNLQFIINRSSRYSNSPRNVTYIWIHTYTHLCICITKQNAVIIFDNSESRLEQKELGVLIACYLRSHDFITSFLVMPQWALTALHSMQKDAIWEHLNMCVVKLNKEIVNVLLRIIHMKRTSAYQLIRNKYAVWMCGECFHAIKSSIILNSNKDCVAEIKERQNKQHFIEFFSSEASFIVEGLQFTASIMTWSCFNWTYLIYYRVEKSLIECGQITICKQTHSHTYVKFRVIIVWYKRETREGGCWVLQRSNSHRRVEQIVRPFISVAHVPYNSKTH